MVIRPLPSWSRFLMSFAAAVWPRVGETSLFASAPPTLERARYEPHHNRGRDCARGFIALIVAGLVLSKSYFNAKELQALLDGAAEQAIGYDVHIHNPWTGDYSFHPKAG